MLFQMSISVWQNKDLLFRERIKKMFYFSRSVNEGKVLSIFLSASNCYKWPEENWHF